MTCETRIDLHDLVEFFTSEHVAAIESLRHSFPRPVDLLWSHDKANSVWQILTQSLCEDRLETGHESSHYFQPVKTESMVWAIRRLDPIDREPLIQTFANLASEVHGQQALWPAILNFMATLMPQLHQLHTRYLDVNCDGHPYGRMWAAAQDLCYDPWDYLVSAILPTRRHELLDHYDEDIFNEMLNAVAALL